MSRENTSKWTRVVRRNPPATPSGGAHVPRETDLDDQIALMGLLGQGCTKIVRLGDNEDNEEETSAPAEGE